MQKENKKVKTKIAVKVVIALSLWIFAAYRFISAKNSAAQETIVTAFNQVQLENMNANVEAFGYFGNVYMSQSAREQMVRNIGYSLGMSGCEVVQTIDDRVMVTEISRNGSSADTSIRLVTKEEKVTDTVVECHQYVDIDIDLKQNVTSALYYKKILEDIMAEYDIASDVTLSLSGCMEGNVNIAIRNLISDRMIELLNGRIVAENRGEDLYTIYAYSKNAGGSITLGGQKINLNISSYYDENTDMTYFYVATPIINADY